jgi:DNA-binding transcriptional MerR regulator
MHRPDLKVGELARRTGISVRTLHYYDEIGLLTPARRGDGNHRLYAVADIARLQQITSLRQLGLSLEEIRAVLEDPDCTPLRVVELHLAQAHQRLAAERALCDRLEALAAALGRMEEVSIDMLMQTIEGITNMDQYFTPEQRAEIAERGRQIGQERIREVEAEWPQLIEQVRVEMERGTDPSSETVQALARRWSALVREFTGGNPGIEQGLRDMYRQESASSNPHLDPRMPEYMAYIGKALQASK